MLNNSFLRQTATTVVFIDASVSDYQTLQTGVIAGVETVILSHFLNRSRVAVSGFAQFKCKKLNKT
ncbi:MAG: hypothetical protein WCO29_14730 [Nostocales cyanobacterium ELA583]|jgi:hypothetical protein